MACDPICYQMSPVGYPAGIYTFQRIDGAPTWFAPRDASGNKAEVTTPALITQLNTLKDSAVKVLCDSGFPVGGDVKSSFVAADHDGWILLDGRAVSTLTATQQAAATGLGFAANLPDASGAYLSQNGAALGSVSGSNSVTLTQANLPNVNFTGVTNEEPDHVHDFVDDTATVSRGANNPPVSTRNNNVLSQTEPAGRHSHTVTVNSGGSDAPIDITPKTLSVNHFVFLGG